MTQTLHPIRALRSAQGLTLEHLGRCFGVHKTTILRWEAKGVPAERVIEIETKLRIPRQRLRPDLYPPKMAGAA